MDGFIEQIKDASRIALDFISYPCDCPKCDFRNGLIGIETVMTEVIKCKRCGTEYSIKITKEKYFDDITKTVLKELFNKDLHLNIRF